MSRSVFPSRKLVTSAPRGGGMTLVELLLALAITGIVAGAASALVFAVSRGTDSRNDVRAFQIRQKTLDARLSAAMRSSRKVLAQSRNVLVLWTGDRDRNNQPNLRELVRIEFNPDTREITAYQAPITLAPAVDTAYNLTEDFEALTNKLKESTDFPGQRWATDVYAWSSTLDTPAPGDAHLVSYSVTLGLQDHRAVMVGAAGLRSGRSSP